jgi:hypothetical protein
MIVPGDYLAWRHPSRHGRLSAMSRPHEKTDEPNLHPGPRDEGGEGGMATRELAASEQDYDDED